MSQCKDAVSKFPSVSGVRRITDTGREHLVANYYGINPFSASERYIFVLSTDVRYYLPEVEDEAVLGIVDVKMEEFIPLTTTRAWNFQQGCEAHWLGTSPDAEIIFNDFDGSRYISRIIDINSRKDRVLSMPVSAVSSDGRQAVSFNYARRRITRPGYGYGGRGQDPRADTPFPVDDGMFVLDVQKGNSELVLSISDVKDFVGLPASVDEKLLMWFSHPLFNKSGTRIFFIARILDKNNVRYNAALTVNPDGSGLRSCFPEPWSWGGSHYDWYSDDVLMVTGMFGAKTPFYSPIIFTDGKNDHRVIAKGMPLGDPHGTFSSCGRYMAADMGDPVSREKSILLVDMKTEAVMPVAQFDVPLKFIEHCRCDLHPHWSPSGRMIAVNSVCEGTRQVYIIEFDTHG